MLISKHGIHGPNSKMADAQNPWGRIAASNASWLKLLYDSRYTTHTVDDARMARSHGLQVLVRTGQGAHETGNMMPDETEVRLAISHFSSLASVIEVGNEPPSAFQTPEKRLTLWDHALRMEEIITHNRGLAHFFGQTLITGGWSMGMPPPDGNDDLSRRVHQVYNLYDGIGVHIYDPGQLDVGYAKDLVLRWHNCFPDKPLYITEYGIAYRWLAGGPNSGKTELQHQMEKVRRYVNFLSLLQTAAPFVVAAFVFIIGGTNDWRAFNDGGYDPHGENSYWLDDPAWGEFGRQMATLIHF